jgi:DnaA family protein
VTDKRAVQIPLPFQRFDHYELAHYLPGANAHVLKHLTGPDAATAFTYLWGEPGTGKSHLLQAVCTRESAAGRRTAYIPLAQHATLAPELLEGMEQLELVCIDDLEWIAGAGDWERALFNLFNRLRDAGHGLVVAAGTGPRGMPVQLADLQSRLQSGFTFHLQPLAETDRLAALRRRAALRGMELSDEVTAYVLRRVPRDMHSLFELLDRLDQASLEAKRKITVPFVKELLDSEV